jgi:cyclase
MPMSVGPGGLEWLDYRTMKTAPLGEALAGALDTGVISEILLVDWRHEGKPESFDPSLVEQFPHRSVPLIAFGGISSADQIRALLARSNVAAVAVGNFLSYREHAIQALKAPLAIGAVRPANFAPDHSLLRNA